MKRFSFVFLLIIWFASSCNFFKKPIIEPKEAELSELLSQAQIVLAKALSSYDIAMTTAMWTQQITGLSGDPLYRYNYVYNSSDVNNIWSDLYSGVMKNCDSIIKLSEKKNAYYFLLLPLLNL